MPCYTVRTTTVEFTGQNVELLAEALIESGMVVRHGEAKMWAQRVVRDGTMTVAVGREDLVDKLKRTYAELAVKKAAKRYGWQVRSTGQNKYAMTRR
jgi:hypothetical protein